VSWARHYKQKKSAAKPIISRIHKRESMAKKKEHTEKKKEVKKAGIPPEKYFVLRSGATIKDLKELALMLDRIDDSDFTFHVNDSKNDFACWIDDVFGRKDIADAIRPIKDKKESQIVLLKQLFLEKARYDSCSKEVVMNG